MKNNNDLYFKYIYILSNSCIGKLPQKEKSPADHRGRRGLETMESQTFLSQKQVPSKAADRLNFAAAGLEIFLWDAQHR